MSMNLYFKVVGSPGSVDFPFQTPTTLAFKVLKATTVEKQMEIVKSYIYDETGWDQEDKDDTWRHCWGLMNSAHLQLEMI